MGFLVLIFWGIVLFDAGQSLWAGQYLRGIMAPVASLLAFAAGSGFRGSLQLKNPVFPAALIGMAVLGASLALMHFFDLTIDLVDGRVWALIGAVVGFLATKKSDVLPREQARGVAKGVSANSTLEDYFDVVGEYGQIMEVYPDTAFPLSKLPLPKEQMKKVLKLVWVAVEDETGKEAIEAGYSHLAYFREDVDEPTSRGLEELGALLKNDTLNANAVSTFSDHVELFTSITTEALVLSREFEDFKSSLAN